MDLVDDPVVPLAEQRREAERDLHLRLSVYPARVKNAKMTHSLGSLKNE